MEELCGIFIYLNGSKLTVEKHIQFCLKEHPELHEDALATFLRAYDTAMKTGMDTKYKTHDLLTASMYFVLRKNGMNQGKSWALSHRKTFIAQVKKHGTDKAVLYANKYGYAYSKTNVFFFVKEKANAPRWVKHDSSWEHMLEVTKELATDPDVSPAVRQKAAQAILQETRQPEDYGKIPEVNVVKDNVVNELKEWLRMAADKDRLALAHGRTILDVAHEKEETPNGTKHKIIL